MCSAKRERIPYHGAQGKVSTKLGTLWKAERFSKPAIHVAVSRERVKLGAITIKLRDRHGTQISNEKKSE